MAKDPLNYRAARKHSLGSPDVERCIGMTSLRLSIDHPPATRSAAAHAEQQAHLLRTRPVALMKWSFDDFIVEEVAPAGVLSELVAHTHETDTPHTSASAPSVWVRVYSEGVPEEELIAALRRHAGAACTLRLLTPLDFVSSTARFVWVRANRWTALRTAFAQPQQLYTRSGTVYTDVAQSTPHRRAADCRCTGCPICATPSFCVTSARRHCRMCCAGCAG